MHRRTVVGVALAALIAISPLAGCVSGSNVVAPEVQRVLAPSGRLRVGLYVGSPTSLVGDPADPTAKGIGLDLGRDLARRLGVPFEPVVFPRNDDVQRAAKEGRVHVVFTNATPARAADHDFTSPFLQVEQGYVVPPGSAVVKMSELDRPGARIGVSQGSTSERILGRDLRAASVVPTPSIAGAVEMLGNGRLEAFATNKAVLFEMSDQLPGARVLAERWGTESFAAGIPKGRSSAMPTLQRSLDDMRATGVVARAVARAGVRGTDVGR